MRVLKFGGTSVADAGRLKLVSDIVLSKFEKKDSIAIVVSAFSGMTDLLLKMVRQARENNPEYLEAFKAFTTKSHSVAKELLDKQAYDALVKDLDENHDKLKDILSGVSLIQEASPKTKDFVVSFGERNCAFILANYLKNLGHPAHYIDARKCIKTDDNYGAAIVDFELTNSAINEQLSKTGNIYIITGFIGSEKDSGVTTTLGRGGSDYTAAIFAAALDAEELEIWTDVNGVLTSDPRRVKKAYTIPELSYQEAAEMSHFGAKVLYGPTISPVKAKDIPTRIKNTFQPKHPGTLIHRSPQRLGKVISGLSSIRDVALVSLEGTGMQGIPGMAYRLFKSIAEGQINIIMITQASSEHSITIAIKDGDKEICKSLIKKEFQSELERKFLDPIKVKPDLCLLAIIGENMKNSPGVAGRLFHTLGVNGVNIEAIAQGSSELNITFAINKNDEVKALNSIHDAFFLSEYKTLHVYMVGVGLIGSTLIRQIKDNYKKILKESRVEIIVNGLSNSRKMLFSEEGIDIDNYKEALDNSNTKADLATFIDKVIDDNHPHTIFVDNTASKLIPEHYERLLENKIAISTPNKIALSSGLERYKQLKALSGAQNIPLNFETNVGAGLPVISTLKSLTSSGDKIKKIEAVLSGSVSYIFNTFDSTMQFSDVVKDAQTKGLTEPDPREDLSGSDVKRKILILARESGFEIEEEDIQIEGILTEKAMVATSIEEFYTVLESDNSHYAKLIQAAETKNSRLRFIASYENGKGKISLQMVDMQNPFYSLNGSDNMIVIYSDRYSNTPLVIRGPGAGADVTAAGLLAEIISMGSVL